MSQDNVGILRAVYERWGRGEIWTPEVIAPDVEVVWGADVPDVGTYHGVAEAEQSMREWFSAWDVVRWKAEEFVDLGDRVLVLIRAHARGKASSNAEGSYAHIWTMRDGKAIRIVGYTDWGAARKSAGLEE